MEPGNLWTLIRDENEGKFISPPLLPDRPGYNSGKFGAKAVTVRVNQYRVRQWPQNNLYQFDVSRTDLLLKLWPLIQVQIKIGNGDEPRTLLKMIWNSPPVQQRLNYHAKAWLWDGNRIAWFAS